MAFVVGVEEGGVKYQGLPREVYVDLLGYLLPVWADKALEAADESNDEDSSESEEDSDDEESDESEEVGSDTD